MPRWRIPNSKPWITQADRSAVTDVLIAVDDGLFEIGSEVAAFERELAEFLGRKYVVCVSSGTVALELVHRATQRKAWLCGAFGFIATANAIERTIGEVIFVESGPECTLGNVPDRFTHFDTIDACQAFGAKLPPSLADCYSFNWNKPITTLGGGCVATDDGDLAIDIRELRNQGRSEGDNAGMAYHCGTNARMSDMAAALGRSQLRRVGEILERRYQVAAWYVNELDHHYCDNKPRESWFLFPIELSNRDEVHAKMLERGIQTRSCADWLLPAHPYYAERYQYEPGMFPEAERRVARMLLLPLWPEMTLEQVQEVCKALEECDARP